MSHVETHTYKLAFSETDYILIACGRVARLITTQEGNDTSGGIFAAKTPADPDPHKAHRNILTRALSQQPHPPMDRLLHYGIMLGPPGALAPLASSTRRLSARGTLGELFGDMEGVSIPLDENDQPLADLITLPAEWSLEEVV